MIASDFCNKLFKVLMIDGGSSAEARQPRSASAKAQLPRSRSCEDFG